MWIDSMPAVRVNLWIERVEYFTCSFAGGMAVTWLATIDCRDGTRMLIEFLVYEVLAIGEVIE